MTQTIRTHVPVPGLGPDCDVHCRLTAPRTAPCYGIDENCPGDTCRGYVVTHPERLAWLGVYSHTRKAWIFPCTQQSVMAALTAAKVVLR